MLLLSVLMQISKFWHVSSGYKVSVSCLANSTEVSVIDFKICEYFVSFTCINVINVINVTLIL